MSSPHRHGMQHSGLAGGAAALLAALLLAGVGCERSAETAAPQPAPRRAGPREVAAQLIAARSDRDYGKIRELTVPLRAQDVVATLLAVDAFVLANAALCELVEAEVGLGAAQAIDQSRRAYHLDLFSKYVELLGETIVGETATVSFLVDGQLPARRTRFLLVDGHWRYDPGPGDYQQLAAAFEHMADGLRQVYAGLQSGRLAAAEFRLNPERLIEEVRLRLGPGVRMLPGQDDDAADSP